MCPVLINFVHSYPHYSIFDENVNTLKKVRSF